MESYGAETNCPLRPGRIVFLKYLTLFEKYSILFTEREVNKMSLDKAIEHKKEHRKPYYKLCEITDPFCRNHGGCPWCEEDRKYKNIKRKESTNEQLREYKRGDKNKNWLK